ncbi:MAG TPA: hypothetical protein VFL10_01865 [Ornithinibacter sp.]|nr:hypothetical protein [Ornithinibacter sp.]
MSPETLGSALRDLVDDVEAGSAPPDTTVLWAGGRRRRRTARLVPLLAAACVAALVGLLVWPGGAPRASVPAVGVDDTGAVRLTAYPSAIPKPPFIGTPGRPGLTAAVLTEESDPNRLYAVSPGGHVTRLGLPEAPLGYAALPSLSPDGRWVARGFVLTDLLRGVTLPSPAARQGLSSTRMPSEQPAWWSPDSRRAYVDSTNQGEITSSGLVVATDGTLTEAPLLGGGRIPVVAGWLDDDTVLAFVDVGEPGSVRLEGRTWRVGDPSWEVSAPDVEPNADGEVADESGIVRAALSPDRTRVLVTEALTDAATSQVANTRATIHDARTGANVGMSEPGVSGVGTTAPAVTSVTWDGWRCRPAWRAGSPLITDRTIRTMTPLVEGGPVQVSTRYAQPCVAFAGDELLGVPTADPAQVWREHLWVWGGRLLVLLSLVGLVRWFTRRRGWRAGSAAPGPPFLPSRG